MRAHHAGAGWGLALEGLGSVWPQQRMDENTAPDKSSAASTGTGLSVARTYFTSRGKADFDVLKALGFEFGWVRRTTSAFPPPPLPLPGATSRLLSQGAISRSPSVPDSCWPDLMRLPLQPAA